MNNSVVIRSLRIKDILRVSKMNLSLEEGDRRFFHPFPFQLWKLAPIIAFISVSSAIHKVLRRFFPQAVFLALVAEDTRTNIAAGFGYLRLKEQLRDNEYIACLGVVINKTYRGGLGMRLMEELIRLASQNNVSRISLTVLSENQRAIHLYRRCGFNIVNEVIDRRNGKSYPAYEMTLVLSKSDAQQMKRVE